MPVTLAWQGRVLEVEIKQGTCRLRTRGGTVRVQVGGRVETVGPEWLLG
jgi:hypothetical protein